MLILGENLPYDKNNFLSRCGSGKSSNLTLIFKPEDRMFNEKSRNFNAQVEVVSRFLEIL